MSQPKHTPGPWTVANIQSDDLWILVRESDADRSVCRMSIDGDVRGESEANARLIAAAPELLEALQLVLNDNRLMNAMSKEQVRAIMASVAKATGGAE